MTGVNKAEANPKFGGSSPWAAEFWLQQGRCSVCKRGHYRQLPDCRQKAQITIKHAFADLFFSPCGSDLVSQIDLQLFSPLFKDKARNSFETEQTSTDCQILNLDIPPLAPPPTAPADGPHLAPHLPHLAPRTARSFTSSRQTRTSSPAL